MKRKTVSFSILALMMMLVATFAMTAPAKAAPLVPATFNYLNASLWFKNPPPITTSSGLVIYIGGTDYFFGTLVVGQEAHFVYVVDTWYSIFNPEAGTNAVYRCSVWYMENALGDASTAHLWWSGSIYLWQTGIVSGEPLTADLNCVLQGHAESTGEWLFLTLHLSTNGANWLVAPWTGYEI